MYRHNKAKNQLSLIEYNYIIIKMIVYVQRLYVTHFKFKCKCKSLDLMWIKSAFVKLYKNFQNVELNKGPANVNENTI